MKIKISIAVLTLGLIVYLFLVWPRQVDHDLNGISFSQLNETNSENVSIKINGQMNNQLFGVREFKGRIYCESIDLDGD